MKTLTVNEVITLEQDTKIVNNCLKKKEFPSEVLVSFHSMLGITYKRNGRMTLCK